MRMLKPDWEGKAISLLRFKAHIQTPLFWWPTNGDFSVLLIVYSKCMARNAAKNSRKHAIPLVAPSQGFNL